MDFDLNLILVPLTIGLAICTAGLALWLALEAIKSKGSVFRALNASLFLITLPSAAHVQKKENEPQKTEKETIAVMEQLYSALANFKTSQKDAFVYGQPSITFEMAVPHIGQEISFYLAVSHRIETVIEKQIHGFFPEAEVEKIKDYNIFNPAGSVAASYLTLSKNYFLPFKTYKNLERDPLAEIINSFNKIDERGEGAAIQIVLSPVSGDWRKRGLEIAREMQKNKTFSKAKEETSAAGMIMKAVKTGQKSKESQSAPSPQAAITPIQQEQIKALEEKASKVGFYANIRLIASSATKVQADEILRGLEGAFAQFNHPNFNSFKINRVSGNALRKLIYNFSFRFFDSRQKMILNSEELTSIFHLPVTPLGAPQLKSVKAKQASAPMNLPKEGLILGKNIFRGQESDIRIQLDDRRRHLYFIGQTGTGKSSALGSLIAQDILSGQGVGVIDPHGDLVEKILGLVSPNRAEDVVLIDPSDMERPVGLNMLEYDLRYPEQKTFIVNELINIFDKLYDLKTTGGPIFEQYTRNALLLLMDDPAEPATLMEVPKVLADKAFRARLLQKCQNPVVKDFWEKEAEKAGGEAALQNIVPYITSKFNVFIANDYMRPIIGQVKSTINYREVIDNKKILLVNLSKGRLGDINSNLLGMINIGKLLMAAFSRIDVPEEQRQDFFLYIDEFQNFATESIATILSEARKYRLNLTIAHQFIGQLTDKIKDAVFGNIGSMIAMRVGAEDAEFLVKQFEPVFDKNDLINIDNFNGYVKLLINGATSLPFNVKFYPPTKGDLELAKSLKQLSRLKYGREKNSVEAEILERGKIATPISG
ncbi:MAG: hypothetical protein CO159_04235 [Candidatus Portnoybacteria bacterium CG_4_9_14_3_um_filter_40_10]|uniref:Uncharacterized protein n=4 Tax=Candidatus Portnoyibacteriota TaxID=1817913 RepID=A0A2M7YMI5_9BACT|nr:MAG: hypothetical protein CO159_04235 [Candidatus Portnoybacteria bacterium CG_4_9_14_3_um_filter_40_10]